MKIFKKYFLTALLLTSFIYSKNAASCSAGCATFNIGTRALIPNKQGGLAYLQYDYINQNHNWKGSSKALNSAKMHKQLKTETLTYGTQYMFNSDWGVTGKITYAERYSVMDSMSEMTTSTQRVRHRALGDASIGGIYSGFFDDMSTGLIFGVKLPTGDYNYDGLNRNEQIGTGSTDSVLGLYHIGNLDSSGNFNYFTQAMWQRPFMTRGNYKPGQEISAAVGSSYNFGSAGFIKKISPIIQFTAAHKSRDGKWGTDISNSGYNQVFFAPALEVGIKDFIIYSEIGIPVYRYSNGSQLVAERTYKAVLGYKF